MGQALQDEAPPQRSGHSKTPLTREEKAALKNYHVRKLLAGAARIETVRGPFDEAKVELKALFDQAKADLGKGYSRKYLTRLMEKVGSTARDLVKEEAQRFEDHTDLALPVFGAQTDMFGGKGDTMPQEAKDEFTFEAEGYLVGRRAGERVVSEGCPPRMHSSFLKGYDKGFDESAKMFAKGGEISAAQSAPEPEVEPEPPAPDFDPAKEAAKLKAAGFTDGAPQSPRQAPRLVPAG